MYGGYDGSASQFAGQGGFLPTPAGGATAGADGAAGGAVRVLAPPGVELMEGRVSYSSSTVTTSRRGRRTPLSFACFDPLDVGSHATRASSRSASGTPRGWQHQLAVAFKFLALTRTIPPSPSSPQITARPGSRGIPGAPHGEAARDVHQRVRRGKCLLISRQPRTTLGVPISDGTHAFQTGSAKTQSETFEKVLLFVWRSSNFHAPRLEPSQSPSQSPFSQYLTSHLPGSCNTTTG